MDIDHDTVEMDDIFHSMAESLMERQAYYKGIY